MSDTNSFSATRARKIMWRFAETTAFEIQFRYNAMYSMKTIEKANMHNQHWLPRPGLARSAHHERIRLLRGYASKSSAALTSLTITQLACELSMRGRSRMALLGPSIN